MVQSLFLNHPFQHLAITHMCLCFVGTLALPRNKLIYYKGPLTLSLGSSCLWGQICSKEEQCWVKGSPITLLEIRLFPQSHLVWAYPAVNNPHAGDGGLWGWSESGGHPADEAVPVSLWALWDPWENKMVGAKLNWEHGINCFCLCLLIPKDLYMTVWGLLSDTF